MLGGFGCLLLSLRNIAENLLRSHLPPPTDTALNISVPLPAPVYSTCGSRQVSTPHTRVWYPGVAGRVGREVGGLAGPLGGLHGHAMFEGLVPGVLGLLGEEGDKFGPEQGQRGEEDVVALHAELQQQLRA